MDNKYLHHLWTKIRPIKTRYLLIACLVFALIGVVSLRQNNLKMVELRDKVYQADEKNGDVEGALQALRAHVYAHMNTGLSGGDTTVYPPIQLKHTYQRLVDAEQKKLSEANANVYSDAQAHCERLFPGSFSGGPRIPCIQEYVTTHGTDVQVKKIPDSLYKFDFVSPSWSPDLAGFSVLLAGVFGAATVVRFFLGRWLKARLS